MSSLFATRTARAPLPLRRMTVPAVLIAIAALVACDDGPLPPPARDATGIRPALSASSGITFADVSAGGTHSCGLKTDGVIVCWGENTYLEVSVPPYLSGAVATSVIAGGAHTCALDAGSTLVCWGYNFSGQASVPAGLEGVGFAQVSAGADHNCALAADGSADCWGYNLYGQVGGAPATVSPYGGEFHHPGPFAQVSAGGWHTCAANADGTVTCWGDNTFGQLSVPAGLSGVTQVSAGFFHTCALTSSGVVACWGAGTTSTGAWPHFGQAAPPTGTFARVSAGQFHSCAVKTDGTVACWGAGTTTTGTDPINDPHYGQAVPPAGTFTRVSAGGWHSCALRTDAAVECWGRNDYGQTSPPAANPAQAITFTTAPANPALVGGSYLVSATGGGSGNPVIFSSLTPAVCGAGPSSGNSSTVSLTSVGTCTVAADQAGGGGYLAAPQATQTFAVVYPFGGSTGGGFAAPVSSTTFNSVKAGQAVPVTFDLGGNRGLLVLAAGYPKSIAIACPTGPVPMNVVPVSTATAGASGLTYDPATGLYTYVWKTDRGWADTCREFTLKLADNSEHTARFQFTR